jgi:hypothetical protein
VGSLYQPEFSVAVLPRLPLEDLGAEIERIRESLAALSQAAAAMPIEGNRDLLESYADEVSERVCAWRAARDVYESYLETPPADLSRAHTLAGELRQLAQDIQEQYAVALEILDADEPLDPSDPD